jgi:hypothetical protein
VYLVLRSQDVNGSPFWSGNTFTVLGNFSPAGMNMGENLLFIGSTG